MGLLTSAKLFAAVPAIAHTAGSLSQATMTSALGAIAFKRVFGDLDRR